MSFLTKRGHITVKAFSRVPALAELPEIQPALDSASDVSSRYRTKGGVDPAEGCFITKTIKYTHQLAYWVNTIRSGDSKDVVSEVPTRPLVKPTEPLLKESVLQYGLCIIPYVNFTLNDPCNLAYCKSSSFVFWNRSV